MIVKFFLIALLISCKKNQDQSEVSSNGDPNQTSLNNELELDSPIETDPSLEKNSVLQATSAPSPVNRNDILSVHNYYMTKYIPGQSHIVRWSGNVAACNAGVVQSASLSATLQRINYFRIMAGNLPPVTLDSAFSTEAQNASLILTANRILTHTPPSTSRCYTASGASGAAKSNIHSKAGPLAINEFIEDYGGGNYYVGHRRWLLFPQLHKVGIGMIPTHLNYTPSIAVHVLNGKLQSLPNFPVAWPPAGYINRMNVYGRWSYSHPNAIWTNAVVSMTYLGVKTNYPIARPVNGVANNTIVWSISAFGPANIINTYDIQIDGIRVDKDQISVNYNTHLYVTNSDSELRRLSQPITNSPYRRISLTNKLISLDSNSRSTACGKIKFNDTNLTMEINLNHGVHNARTLMLNHVTSTQKIVLKEVPISGYGITKTIALSKYAYDILKGNQSSISIASNSFPRGEIESKTEAIPTSDFCQIVKPNVY